MYVCMYVCIYIYIYILRMITIQIDIWALYTAQGIGITIVGFYFKLFRFRKHLNHIFSMNVTKLSLLYCVRHHRYRKQKISTL